ncbi:crotonase/enoyl-CoA hydratase family protein [Diaminobutyricibacter sp. McL0618]|uniref:crotonase/enoyl-CoA hydratase family protein n=1 Tax=Leifsonia sp. McL0618 TaxID=3415677 RepID=UPI003CF84B36
MTEPRILTERRGHVLLIGFNRPDKRNAADFEFLSQLSLAYGELERDPDLRAGLVYAVGDHFTAGLDLADLGPRIGADGIDYVTEGGINPWQVSGEQLSKPVVIAVQGTCLTLGIELMLASDVAVAAQSTRFGQVEVTRGILPFGGATLRFPRAVGWGNAMRWILTGDYFDAAEAHRIGLVQEVVPDGEQFDRALAIAERIAAQAPLAVQATLANAKLAIRDGDAAAESELQPALARLATTKDARIGMEAFLRRTEAQFVGR